LGPNLAVLPSAASDQCAFPSVRLWLTRFQTDALPHKL